MGATFGGRANRAKRKLQAVEASTGSWWAEANARVVRARGTSPSGAPPSNIEAFLLTLRSWSS
eukprot:4619491-Pyramimonas_sp.AAC.1